MEIKIDNLETTNTLMKEDLSVSHKALKKAHQENQQLLSQLERLKAEQNTSKQKSNSQATDLVDKVQYT